MSRDEIKNTSNIFEVKEELTSDLDQFLAEEKTTNNQPIFVPEKSDGLKQIDRLIKQDLLTTPIIPREKVSQNSISPKQTFPKSVNLTENFNNRSAFVLNLKQERSAKLAVNTDDKWKNLQKNISKVSSVLTRPRIVDKTIDEQKVKPKKEKRNIHWGTIFKKSLAFGLTVFVLLLPLRALVVLSQINQDASKIFHLSSEGIVNLQSGVLSAAENSYLSADNKFDQALINLGEAHSILEAYNKWLDSSSAFIPVLGKKYNLGNNLINASLNISQAAKILNTQAMQDARPTEYLQVLADKIRETLPYLQSAQKDLSAIDKNELPVDYQEEFSLLQDNLPLINHNLKTIEEISTFLAAYLGQDGEKRYLVLFQNNNELRATGGFIGSIAIMDIYKGKITNLEVPRGGTYDLAYGQKVPIAAPHALSLINPNFNIWDANWWPDFPTSASKIAQMYQKNIGGTVDGVISVNAEVLGDLLKITGPISLDQYNITVDSNNFYDVLQNEVEFGKSKEINQPKSVISDLVPMIIEKLSTNKEKWSQILSQAVTMVQERSIQIYSSDPQVQKQIHDLGWSGELISNNKDFLAVINTNLAGGKTDKDIYQSIEHRSDILSNGKIVNTVTITRTNKGEDFNALAGIDGGNVSYLRIYVPLGAKFIEASGFDQIDSDLFKAADNHSLEDETIKAEEDSKVIDSNSGTEIYQSLDRSVFANWLALRPGESQTVYVKYELPFKFNVKDSLVNDLWHSLMLKGWYLDDYSLAVYKQAGDLNSEFSSTVTWPENLKIIWSQALEQEYFGQTDRLATYAGPLDKDIYFGFVVAGK